MSLFRSLHVRYEEADTLADSELRPWPAVYRDKLAHISLDDFALQIRIENQLPKTMGVKQLAALPSFTENRRISSRAGWTYYGQWKGLTFQTLFALFATPNLYPWVRLETATGEEAILDRSAVMNYRLVLAGDGQPLSPLYGGPVWAHHFDEYVEYSLPSLKSITLMKGDFEPKHPAWTLGFMPEQAHVAPGTYYDMHRQRITTL